MGNTNILNKLVKILLDPALDKITASDALNYKTALIDLGLKPGTINVHLTLVAGLFKWAVKFDRVDKNYFDGLAVKKTVKPSEECPVYSADHLRLAFPYKALRPQHKWIPVIALFSGMRLNEIAQLYVEDVGLYQGVYCFNIREGHSDQSVKSKAGIRLVPIHQKLIDFGFLEYVQQQNKLVGHAESSITNKWA